MVGRTAPTLPESRERLLRKLTYFIAVSFDGFVSRLDGNIDDFAFDGEHVADLLQEFPETIPTHLRPHLDVSHECPNFDTVLMGRLTYEVGLLAGFGNPYQHLKQYVFSKSPKQAHDDAVHLVTSDPIDKVRKLKEEDGNGIWLCGGPTLASVILDEIDELVVKVNPFLMGSGKTLFASEFPKLDLIPTGFRNYDNGFSIRRFQLK